MTLPSFTLPLGSSVIPGRIGETADVVFWDDFTSSSGYTKTNAATADIGMWTVSKHADTNADKGTVVFAGSSRPNGCMSITGSSLDSSDCVALDNVVCVPNFTVTYNSQGDTYFETRVRASTVAEQIWMGFQSTSGVFLPDPFSAAAADYILFKIVAADIKCQSSLATSAGTLTDTGVDLVADTWTTLAINISQIKGVLTAQFYVDGDIKTELTANLPAVGTKLAPMLAVAQTSTDATVTADFDYCLVASKRVD